MNLYGVLDLDKEADASAIKRAHRKAAKKHHPDAGGSRDRFEQVQHAYVVLSDPLKREKYDRTGEHEEQPDNVLSELAELIIPAFDHALAQVGDRFSNFDLIARTCELLKQRKGQIMLEKKAIEGRIKQHNKLLKLIKFDNEGADIIGNAYKQRILSMEKEIEQFEKVSARLLAAIEYLKHYGFEFTQQRTQPASDCATVYVRLR